MNIAPDTEISADHESEMSYTMEEQPNAEVVDSSNLEGHIADRSVRNLDEWDPTEEELLAIAFADDDRYIREVERGDAEASENENDEVERGRNVDAPVAEDDADGVGNADTLPRPESRVIEHDGQTNDESTEANMDFNPQNPWGMSDAALEQLRIDQERFWGFVRDRDTAPKPFECACGESSMEPYGFVNLTCADNCVRCVECLNQNVRVGLESRKNYPPMCCIPIDFENVLDHLEPVLIDRWLDVKTEFEDVAPVYCSIKECSLYLPKTSFIEEGKWALCGNCDIKTCTACLCPESQHKADSAICPDRLDKMDKELILKKGWKACPRCKEMIERTEGCDHMICECGHEFCYGCGHSFEPPFPCNCRGQNQWAAQHAGEADPQRQQDILNGIVIGENPDEVGNHPVDENEGREDQEASDTDILD